MRLFNFGLNWQAFSSQRLDARGLDAATRSLGSLLQRDTLQGVSFLDVGCGSGLFSIAAQRLGAARVVGLDVNPVCIAVSEQNHACWAPDAPITFEQASVLDAASLDKLGHFDIVYAWGSLHHTGAMWNALRNVTQRVVPGGTLALSIYNKHLTSPIWRVIKRLYNQLPSFLQQPMAVLFAGVIYVAKFLVTRRNPLEKERGMDFWYDVVDWIGGYPYEFASPAEVTAFVTRQGFQLRHFVAAQVPTGCNEFVFERAGAVGGLPTSGG